MSTWFADVTVRKHQDAPDARTVTCFIDLGIEATVIPGRILQELGIIADASVSFRRADGTALTRRCGQALVELQGRSAYAPVAFGESGDVPLLARSTLAALGLFVDPLHRGMHPLQREA